MQKQLQELEKAEYEKWIVSRNNKIRNLLNQLKTKQENEAAALRQRIEQGFEEQKKTASFSKAMSMSRALQSVQNKN